jgi:protease IV
MKKSPWKMIGILFVVFAGLWAVLLGTKMIHTPWGGGAGSGKKKSFSMHEQASILKIEMNGMIIDGKRVLKPLIKYRDQEFIKAVVIEVNSPGGVVGPSQELYEEIKRVREVYHKPVVVVSTGLMASGAFYAAVAADKIMVQPGTLVGSIGVIMQFTNLEKLYDWAKVSRFSITTGKYKDSGADYRNMRADEREVFQSLINNVWEQFTQAVATGRNLDLQKVKSYSDGRVFTGLQAKEMGLVDELGTTEDAYELAAKLTDRKLEDMEIFEPPREQMNWWRLLSQGDDEADSVSHQSGVMDALVDHVMERVAGRILGASNTKVSSQLLNRPLALMPGSL